MEPGDTRTDGKTDGGMVGGGRGKVFKMKVDGGRGRVMNGSKIMTSFSRQELPNEALTCRFANCFDRIRADGEKCLGRWNRR